jgi:ribosomal protein S27E
MAIDGSEPVLRVLPTLGSGAEVRTMRARCSDCGAHAAVVTAGASVTGACSVCGSGMLQLMDEHLPPPRRWAL